MTKLYGSSGRRADPLATMGTVVGAVAAVIAGVLWYSHMQPESRVFGDYSGRIANGNLREQLLVLSAVLGVLGVIAGVGGSLGGRARASAVAALALGVFGVSYWALTALGVFSRVVPSPL